MELVGFKVDQVFIVKWLKRNIKKTPELDAKVLAFIQDKDNFMKQRAVELYRQSTNPLEKLEFRLNDLIGPAKLKKRID